MKTKKWMQTLALTTAMILMSSAAAAFAEGEEAPAPAPEPPKQEEVKKEEPKPEPKPEPKAEAPKEEPKAEEPKAEAPKAEEPKAEEPKAEEPKAEAPADTPAEAPAEPEAPAEDEEAEEDVVFEETAEPAEGKEVEIEENEAPLGVGDAPAAPVPFTGSVKVERKGSGAIFFGDRVTLEAKIQNANTGFDIRWEVNRQDGEGWRKISGEDGKEYSFVITEGNANYEYRVVLVTAA